MPELPEVEQFRRLLLPLTSANDGDNNDDNNNNNHYFQVVQYQNHGRLEITNEQIREINNTATTNNQKNENHSYICHDVVRKGKQLCLILKKRNYHHQQPKNDKKTNDTNDKMIYFYLHMGMTGCIRIQGKKENWGDKSPLNKTNKYVGEGAIPEEVFPPKYTMFVFQKLLSVGSSLSSPTTQSSSSSSILYQAAFTDPRKFGSCSIREVPYNDDDAYEGENMEDPFVLSQLAPDALTTTDPNIIENTIIPKLMNQSLGIKAVLLDQKRAVCGVGNWIADEVLYQCCIHPDQKYLSYDEAQFVWRTLHEICTTAVHCLQNNTHYPENWLFGYRWSKGKNVVAKDAYGRTLSFLTSGGRTSAIVTSIQKLKGNRTNKKQKQQQRTTKEEKQLKRKRTTSKSKKEIDENVGDNDDGDNNSAKPRYAEEEEIADVVGSSNFSSSATNSNTMKMKLEGESSRSGSSRTSSKYFDNGKRPAGEKRRKYNDTVKKDQDDTNNREIVNISRSLVKQEIVEDDDDDKNSSGPKPNIKNTRKTINNKGKSQNRKTEVMTVPERKQSKVSGTKKKTSTKSLDTISKQAVRRSPRHVITPSASTIASDST